MSTGRWPSRQDMKRLYERIKRQLPTGRSRSLSEVKKVLDAFNQAINAHGVEYIIAQKWDGSRRALYYVNLGDPYDWTLTYDTHTFLYRIQAWGDWLESVERRGWRAD